MFSFAAYMSSPCHIELVLSEKEEPVKKEVIHRNLLSDLNVQKQWGVFIHLSVGLRLMGSSFCSLRCKWLQVPRRAEVCAVALLLE